MAGFLLRRLGASLLLLLLVLTLAFFLVRATPGDPTYNPRLTAAQQARMHQIYGLDRPLGEQYLAWLGAAARFDWGTSISQQRPVAAAVRTAAPATLLLAAAALFVEYSLALLLGVAAARRPGSALDHAIRVGGLVFYALPVFWLGLMAILVFSYLWPLFPAGQMHSIDADLMGPGERLLDLLRHLALPALVTGLGSTGGTARFVRARMLDVLGQDYIRTARAKGLSEARVLWVHALRNAGVPVVQLLALTVPGLLSGALVTEVVFSWPGLGQLAFNAISTRDYPLVLATTALSAGLVIAANLGADLLHAWLDPRVRHG